MSKPEEPWRRSAAPPTNEPRDSWRRPSSDRDEGWRRSTGPRFDSSNNGQRPKLNLTKRGEADNTANVGEATDKLDKVDLNEDEQRPRQRSERRFREPEVVNSRAAMLGEVPAPRKEELNNDRRTRDRRTDNPPPIQNERFAKLAAESKSTERRREAPVPTNSRFAAVAADYDRQRTEREREREDRGPPVPQNSRFAAAAADYDRERGERADHEERGKPVVQNSRFASAAADYDRERGERERDRAERGERFERRRDDDRGRYGRDSGPPPIPQNSRFAAAMDSDPDYVPAEVRNQRERERAEQGERGERFGRDGDDRRDGGRGGFGGERGGRYNDRGGRYNRDENGEVELPRGPSWKQDPSLSGADNAFPPVNKGNVSNILAPKKREEETVLPPVAVPLTLPGEDEEAAKARLEKVRAEKEAKAAKEKAEEEAKKAEEARLAEEAKERAAKAQEAEESLLNEFISGKKLGQDLQQWCVDQAAVLPSVEKLVYHLLTEKEQKNPDPECAWAEPDQYGTALLSLVEDKGYEQMQILWAIQKYCDFIGFPKLNDEYVVQSMFRAMYKYDLTEAGAFDEWKEDELEANSRGKMKAVIQTMDWFAWLEEDDEEDDDEYEEEE